MFTTPFLMTTLAGISTLLGSILIFFKNKEEKVLSSSLAFAAGVMITVSLSDLIPSSIYKIGEYCPFFATFCLCLIGINIGILLSNFIEKKVSKKENSSTLYKIGLISMLAIILHNIPEGIATYISCKNDFNLGLKLTIAIALHNIPEGISISVPIYYASKSKKKAFFYTFISGFSEVVGAVISYLFLGYLENDLFMGFLYSIIAGIMITISIKELIPESLNYKLKKKTILFFIIGFIFMFITHIFL